MKKYRNMEFLNLLLELAKLLEPKTYVEIGVQRGYTFKEMAKVVEKAVAVDILPMDHIPDLPNIEKYQMTSEEFGQSWYDSGNNLWIDFAFIDADHSKEQVLKDFKMISEFIRPHTGLIFLHDTFPVVEELLTPGYCNDAWKAAKQIHRNQKTRREFEIVTIPGPWAGLSIIRKVGKTHGWMDNG